MDGLIEGLCSVIDGEIYSIRFEGESIITGDGMTSNVTGEGTGSTKGEEVTSIGDKEGESPTLGMEPDDEEMTSIERETAKTEQKETTIKGKANQQ